MRSSGLRKNFDLVSFHRVSCYLGRSLVWYSTMGHRDGVMEYEAISLDKEPSLAMRMPILFYFIRGRRNFEALLENGVQMVS